MKQYLNKINRFKLPKLKIGWRLVLYFLTLSAMILSILELNNNYFPKPVEIAVDVAAAAGLLLSSLYLFSNIGRTKKGAILMLEKYSLTDRVHKDYKYRTVLITWLSLIINIVYGTVNGILGIVNRSPWLITFAVYYGALSIMRYGIIRYDKKISKTGSERETRLKELNVYRDTGVCLVFVTVALGGAVILLLNREGGQSYDGTLIYAVAAYTFYKITAAVIHIIKAGKEQSMLFVAIRAIGYADALVSMLFLQTAMFASFGSGEEFEIAMNGITGGTVCTMIICTGIYMIYMAGKKKRKYKQSF